MILPLGLILVVGSIYTSSPNELYPTYMYKAHFTNTSVVANSNIYYSTDDDDYRVVVNLSVDFDIYYNAENPNYMVDNFILTTSIDYYTNYGGNYSDNVALSDALTYTHTGNLYAQDLEDLNINVRWSLLNEDDRLGFGVEWNSAPRVFKYSTIYLGATEEIHGTYGIEYNLHFNYATSEIFEYINSGGTYQTGYQNGYGEGFADGTAQGYDDGLSSGYQQGYGDGFQEASDQNSVAVTIFAGICEVGLLPVNVFLGILNFEVFGINIGGFVASLMTIAIVVIVIRVVLGAKSKE